MAIITYSPSIVPGINSGTYDDDIIQVESLQTLNVDITSTKITFQIIRGGILNITANVEFLCNVVVHDGGLFDIDSGFTLSFSGTLQAGIYQIFMGSGSVAGRPQIDYVYPQWFGAKTDGSDTTASIQKAIDTGADMLAPIRLPSGVYNISSSLKILNSGVIFEGEGNNLTSIVGSGSAVFEVGQLGGNQDIDGIYIRDIFIGGASGSSPDGIVCKHITEGQSGIERVRIKDCNHAITLEKVFGFFISHCRIHDNSGWGILGTGDPTDGGATNQITLINNFVKANFSGQLKIPLGTWTVVGGVYEMTGRSAPDPNASNIVIADYAYNVNLTGVYSENAPQHNIKIFKDVGPTHPTNINILGCYLNSSGHPSSNISQIFVGESTGVTIQGCRFDHTKTPIEVTSEAKDISIRNIYNESVTETIKGPVHIDDPIVITAELLRFSKTIGGNPTALPNQNYPGGNVNDYHWYQMDNPPNPNNEPSLVASIPWPTNWTLGRYKASVYSVQATGSVTGIIQYEVDITFVRPGIDAMDEPFPVDGIVTTLTSVGTVVKLQEHISDGTFGGPGSAGSPIARIRVVRKHVLTGGYNSYDRLVAVKIYRVG